MAEKEAATRAPSTSSSISTGNSTRPTITLPPRTSSSSMESILTGFGLGGGGPSPGPMTLVSSFFNGDPDSSDCRSFTQLLNGSMYPSPSARHHFQPAERNNEAERGGGGMFTVPPGLSPATLLDSPGFFSSGQGPFGISHHHFLAQVTAQAQAQLHNQTDYQSLSAAPVPSMSQLQSFTSNTAAQHQMHPPARNPSIVKESADISNYDQRSQSASFVVDKPADDGYNWRKYGQKQVKGSEYPRSYYKCTHQKCPVKKKVERSFDGQVTEIIYKGQHNHQPPKPNRRAIDAENPIGGLNHHGNSLLGSSSLNGNLRDGVSTFSSSTKDQDSSQVTPEHMSGSSGNSEEGDAETGMRGRDSDEPQSKRRNTEVQNPDPASSHRTVTEPRIIVQTTSEVDLLDDGYRWRKYGQKVVKGNPYPRSYYKCTSPGCNVRKHVERAASDPKAVITTYEGKHNHDVPAAKNSSHSTANNAAMLKPHAEAVDRPALVRKEFGNNDQQPIARLQFKEEQIT